MTQRKTRDLCQTDWQDANPGEYFPNADRSDRCAECGSLALVARSTIAQEANRLTTEAPAEPRTFAILTLTTRQPVAAITVDATDAADAESIARAMYGWPGDHVTTAELTPGLWHVTLHREPAGIPVHAEPGSLAARIADTL